MMKLEHSKIVVWLLLFITHSASAQWSGIILSFGDETIPVKNNQQHFILTPSSIQLTVEDDTNNSLRIGVSAAQVNANIKNNSLQHNAPSQALRFFIKAPLDINEYLSLEAMASISQHFKPTSAVINSLEWITKQASVSSSITMYPIRIGTTLHLRTISGAFIHNAQQTFFEEQNATYQSYFIDYLTERNAYIRFSRNENSNNTFKISFAKVY